MTSNQIAYAVNQESIRHNQAVEAETERSNKAMEALKERDIANEELRTQNDAWYKQESTRISREYNNIYYELQHAAQEEKAWYESQLVNLEEEKNYITKTYNDMMNSRKQEENLIRMNVAEEEVRHNKELESLTRDSNQLKWKQLDFEKTQFRENLGLKWSEFELDRQRLDFNYEELALNRDRYYMEYEFKGAENLLRKEELNYRKDIAEREIALKEGLFNKQLELMQSEKIRNYADIFTKNRSVNVNAFSTLLKATSLFF